MNVQDPIEVKKDDDNRSCFLKVSCHTKFRFAEREAQCILSECGCRFNRSLRNCAGRVSKIFNQANDDIFTGSRKMKDTGNKIGSETSTRPWCQETTPWGRVLLHITPCYKREKRGQRELYCHSKQRPTTLTWTAATRFAIRDHSHSPLKLTRN